MSINAILTLLGSEQMRGSFSINTQSPLGACLGQALSHGGYLPVETGADFNDGNLLLDGHACELLENKALLTELLTTGCDYYPLSFVVDDRSCQKIADKIDPNAVWIVKPARLNNGVGIELCFSGREVDDFFKRRSRYQGQYLIQQYIDPPYLLNGRKFSNRLFLLMTNFSGAYLYQRGYYNCCMQKYQPPKGSELSTQLTNEHLASIHQKPNTQQVHSDEFSDFELYYQQYKAISVDLVNRLQEKTNLLYQKPEQYAFSLFGVDFMLDQHQKPWLLEVNHGPCFPISTQHPLFDSLYKPFWCDIVEHFVDAVWQKNKPINLTSSLFEKIA